MRKVRPVKVKSLTLDGNKIYVQSMLNIISTDISGNVKQAKELEAAGCRDGHTVSIYDFEFDYVK